MTRAKEPVGTLALVLHAHLPLVRHPEHGSSMEEAWLFESLIECYLPLLDLLEELADRRPPPRLTLVLSPTLLFMLRDDYLRSRFEQHLLELDALCDRLARAFGYGERQELVIFHRRMFRRARQRFFEHWRGNLSTALNDFRRCGCLELMTTALTHAYLPCLDSLAGAAEVQVEGGLAYHQHVFGTRPQGFWLPECGITPRLARLLESCGVGHSVIETHGLLLARPRPPYGVFAPIRCGRLALFGREPQSSRQVWSRNEGFPSHRAYREFFYDAASECPPERLGPFSLPGGRVRPTGIKLYSVTGPQAVKKLYRPAAARAAARRHAAMFLRHRAAQLKKTGSLMKDPIVVAPYDAELFGHWWYEGPVFLREVFRLWQLEPTLRLETLSEYLHRRPSHAFCEPAASSWGAGGYHRVWLSPGNDYMLPALGRVWERFLQALGDPRIGGERRRLLRQVFCELLLAQASDWPFMVFWNSGSDYARERFRDHLSAAGRLLDAFFAGLGEARFVEERESRFAFLPDGLLDELISRLAKKRGSTA